MVSLLSTRYIFYRYSGFCNKTKSCHNHNILWFLLFLAIFQYWFNFENEISKLWKQFLDFKLSNLERFHLLALHLSSDNQQRLPKKAKNGITNFWLCWNDWVKGVDRRGKAILPLFGKWKSAATIVTDWLSY